jgi:hypothetical protein
LKSGVLTRLSPSAIGSYMLSGKHGERHMGVEPLERAQSWLNDWVEENLNAPHYVESKEQIADEAKACVTAAGEAGIPVGMLVSAAGGDLQAYLMRQQNALTDAEVRRLADKEP